MYISVWSSFFFSNAALRFIALGGLEIANFFFFEKVSLFTEDIFNVSAKKAQMLNNQSNQLLQSQGPGIVEAG